MVRLARYVGIAAFSVLAFAGGSAMAQPITTDSRIKTFVYSPNEVFSVTTHYGYQSNIEFGPQEVIQTISVGDRVGWQISPSGQRLFIRAQEENAHTNMTVVTDRHAYQFDLRSSSADAVFGSEQLTYVVRFYYPEDHELASLPPGGYMPAAQMRPPVAASQATSAVPLFNYRYTYSGPGAAAPLKIFDDGKRTFFKFSPGANPSFAVVSATGEALPVIAEPTNDGLLAVNVIASRFQVTQNGQQVFVYNEAGEQTNGR